MLGMSKNEQTKSAVSSSGFWGSVAVIAVAVGQMLDVEITADELLTLGAGLVALWGRVTASSKITGFLKRK